ncbi:MAG: T9SS type A sorting domain-containing protein [Saprospiraceae bacterium]|nr:T9SS type A sorting domain-containing protein [Saprospiraceae bacterium]
MMKRICLFTLICFSGMVSFAQYSNWSWAEQSIDNYSSQSNGVVIDASLNVYACGYFQDSSKFGSHQVYNSVISPFIVKYDSTGICQWVVTLSTTIPSFTNKILLDHQNNIIVLGNFRGFLTAGNFTLNSQNKEKFFLVKISPSGTVLWAKQATGSSNVSPTDIVVDNNNNVFVTGFVSGPAYFDNFISTKIGMYIIKYNENGTALNLINQSDFTVNSLEISSTDKLFLSGSLYSTIVLGHDTIVPVSLYDFQYDSVGVIVDTTKHYGVRFAIICLNDSGNVVWNRQARKSYANYWDVTGSDEFSNYYIGGNGHDTIDFWGTMIYPPTEWALPHLIKIDSLGNLKWYITGTNGSPQLDFELTELKSVNNNIYAAGRIGGYCKISNMHIYSNSNYVRNSFILKLDSLGNGVWSIIDTTNHDRNETIGISVTNNEDIAVSGFFAESVLFGNHYLWNNGSFSSFVASISSKSVGLKESYAKARDFNIIVYPNPSKGIFKIITSGINKDFQISVFNIEGQEIHKQFILNRENIEMDLSTYPKGVYFIRLWNNDFVKVEKIVLQ